LAYFPPSQPPRSVCCNQICILSVLDVGADLSQKPDADPRAWGRGSFSGAPCCSKEDPLSCILEAVQALPPSPRPHQGGELTKGTGEAPG
jgi:hypothetical protein